MFIAGIYCYIYCDACKCLRPWHLCLASSKLIMIMIMIVSASINDEHDPASLWRFLCDFDTVHKCSLLFTYLLMPARKKTKICSVQKDFFGAVVGLRKTGLETNYRV